MKILDTLTRPPITWFLAACVGLMATGVLILESGLAGTVLQVSEPEVSGEIPEFVFDGHGGAGYAIGMTLIAVLGAVIVTRTSNRTGALLTLVVFTDVIGALFAAYGYRSLIIGELPGGVAVGLIGSIFPPVLLALAVPALILHFPTGRLRTHRWRWVLAMGLIVTIYLVVGQLAYPLVLSLASNPIRAPWSLSTANDVLGVGWTAWMGLMVATASSLLWRGYDGVQWLIARRRDPDRQPTSRAATP